MDRASLGPRRTRRSLVPAAAATLTVAMLLAPTDADAQRRRRRHREPSSGSSSSGSSSSGSSGSSGSSSSSSSGSGSGSGSGSQSNTTTGSQTTNATSSGATTNAGATNNVAPVNITASGGSGASSSRVEAPPPTPTPPANPTAMRPAAIDFQIGARFFGRSFWFTDDLFSRLRPYLVVGTPGVGAAVEWYPGAHFSTGAASMFGIYANGQYNFVLSSTDAQGRSYPTTSYGFDVGLRVRYVFWRADVGVTLGYAHQAFTIDRGNVIAPPEGIMSVTYQSLRGGLSGRIQLVPRFALLASAAYLLVLNTGELGSMNFFPHLNAGGVDFGLGAAVGITSWFEVRLNFDWRRYFMAMNPMQGDPLVAGGAVDDYFAATLSVAVRR